MRIHTTPIAPFPPRILARPFSRANVDTQTSTSIGVGANFREMGRGGTTRNGNGM